ncbi:MAG TPA: hypothetical protein VN366_08040 [Feifaniaceae bacterium]|nr:hypothetical protein [Feifaniaceae bacterium]
MELQYRVTRQMIDIAVSKAMEDMESNVKRGVRNLVDLGLLFSKSENQKRFFTAARKVVSNPGNPYYPLVTRMISDVDHDTIKKVGLNLGYNSLVYGAKRLKKRQEDTGLAFPGLLIFDISESGPAILERCIQEGQELGIYSYIICPHERGDISAICEIAARFDESLFILKGSSGLISEQTAGTIGNIHNIAVSVQVTGTGFDCAAVQDAFRILKRNRCLYGFHVTYNEETVSRVTAPEYIRSAIGLGNFFGAYTAEDGVSDAARDAVYAFACKGRGENGQPLVPLDWYRDIQDIGEQIFSGAGQTEAPLVKRVYCEYIKAKDMLTKSLLEILRGLQPCTSM